MINSDINRHYEILTRQALAVVETRLTRGPESSELWIKKGDLLRQLGSLQEASDAFARAVELGSHSAGYLASLLSGQPTQVLATGLKPAPFIRVNEFMSPKEIELIWSTFDSVIEAMRPSSIGRRGKFRHDSSQRESLYADSSEFPETTAWFCRRLEPELARGYELLNVERPAKPRTTLQMTLHSDGDFYTIHRDTEQPNGRRRLSFVYYLHLEPQQFSGGELRLYDTDARGNRYGPGFTTLRPRANSLVLFPSYFYHEVNTVRMNSDDPRSGRLTLNGWHINAGQSS